MAAMKIPICGLLLFLAAFGNGESSEGRLYRDLLTNHSPLERPVAHFANAVNVSLGLSLQQLISVDEQNQLIEVNAWMQYAWTDYKMVWEPMEYGGIADVRFPASMLWRPDVLIFNSVDPNFDSSYHSQLIVTFDGTVSWIPPSIIRTSCKMDIRWFPFDRQRCTVKFGSWSYHALALDLIPGQVDTSEYLTNGEWDLVKAETKRNVKVYDCCPEPFVDLEFVLHLRRRVLYYVFNFVAPSLLITVMTVMGFLLPADAGEKIGLEITVLLSVCFFLQVVSDMTPPTSEALPIIGTFFTCCMVIVSASVLCTVVVLSLHHRTEDQHGRMSPVTRMILLCWLPTLLCMRTFEQDDSEDTEDDNSENCAANQVAHTTSGQNSREPLLPPALSSFHLDAREGVPQADLEQKTCGNVRSLDALYSDAICVIMAAKDEDNRYNTPLARSAVNLISSIESQLRWLTARQRAADKSERIEAEWRYGARVVDRACLMLFTACIVGSAAAILCSPPEWLE